MLGTNKMGKYLLYAIGEILLVVIGIIIALNINNRNELRKTELKTIEILKEIQNDLGKDILEADETMAYYQEKKSWVTRILNNNFSYDDHKNNPLDSKFLILTAKHIKIHDNGYKILMQNTNNIPDKYRSVIDPLNEIYVYNKYEIDKFDDKIDAITNDFEGMLMREYDWYYSFSTSPTITDEVISYFSDSIYKNYAYRYAIAGWGSLSANLSQFRFNAVEVYLAIAKLIGNEDEVPEYINHNFLKIDLEILKRYTGNFNLVIDGNEVPSSSASKIEISLIQNQLVYEASNNSGTNVSIYFKSASIGYDKNGYEFEFTRNEDGTLKNFVRRRQFSLINRRIAQYEKID